MKGFFKDCSEGFSYEKGLGLRGFPVSGFSALVVHRFRNYFKSRRIPCDSFQGPLRDLYLQDPN